MASPARFFSFVCFDEAAEGEECQRRIRLYLMRYLELLYNNKKFTYLSLSYYATVADLPPVFL